MITRHLSGITSHELQEGERWEDFGMDQPGKTFTHNTDWPFCPRCMRPLALRGVLKP